MSGLRTIKHCRIWQRHTIFFYVDSILSTLYYLQFLICIIQYNSSIIAFYKICKLFGCLRRNRKFLCLLSNNCLSISLLTIYEKTAIRDNIDNVIGNYYSQYIFHTIDIIGAIQRGFELSF